MTNAYLIEIMYPHFIRCTLKVFTINDDLKSVQPVHSSFYNNKKKQLKNKFKAQKIWSIRRPRIIQARLERAIHTLSI